MHKTIYISVILPLKLEWEPCYSLPDDVSCVSAGDRVKVRFANKEYIGVVSRTNIKPETEVSRIRTIIALEKNLDRISPEEIQLWRNVAEYYLCTIGEVYKAAYPTGKTNLEEAHAAAMKKMQARKERLIQSMHQKKQKLELRLEKKLYLLEKTKDCTISHARLQDAILKLRNEIRNAEDAVANMDSTTNVPMDQSYANGSADIDTILNAAQQEAYGKIINAFGDGKPVMLHGITGSGKTEIYIKAAKETFRNGQNVLYLVPEIALSRQLEERLYRHFGERLMTFHSGESAASRRNTSEAVRRLRDGKGNYMILGTRSSLFLPHFNLGLIIVDEEHDSSYKQDSPSPRYNGRDTALMLCQIQKREYGKCNIILGSATPSLEELYNCKIGKHVLVKVSQRYHQSEDPDIKIIDTKAERRKNGMAGSFSRKLIHQIDKTVKGGGQVLILRSRRAWAPAVQCEDCGEIQKCPHCNVSLSLHKTSDNTLVCHYCGYKTAYDNTCSKCHGTLRSLGAGTQKIEEEASVLFPEARIARLDSDTAQSRSYETRTIKEFSKGDIDILIGTQMLSKGFDFSNLKLVAIIAADTLLGMQDFRADEKALQLLEQLSGRCGRRKEKGLFIIQTAQPEHPIYSRLATNNGYAFYEDLMKERQDFDFPPFSRIIELTIKDTSEKRLVLMSSRLSTTLSDTFPNAITGPYSPPVDRISDTHIRMIRISLRKDRLLKEKKRRLTDTISDFEKGQRYDGHITVNVDPS